MTTPILTLPEVTDGQASQGAIHNQALREIGAKTVRVISRTTAVEPGSPADGDSYILPTGFSGASWGGGAVNRIAHYIGGVWQFYAPVEGWRVWVNDENNVVAYDGSAWDIQASLLKMPAVAITTTTSVTATHRGRVLVCDTTGGSITLNLLAAATAGNGFILAVKKKVAGNTLIIDPSGAELIDDSATLSLTEDEDSRILVCDGAEWHAVGGGGSGGGGLSLPISDVNTLFENDSDTTKTLKFSLSGLTTGTERTATWPNKNITVAGLDDVAPGGNGDDQFAEDSANHNGLLYAYKAGAIRANHVVTLVSAGTVLLADATTNYVECNNAGVVSSNTTGFTSGRFPMAIVTTVAGSPSGIDVVTDRRAWATTGVNSTFSRRVRQTLTDKTSFAGTSAEQWGTEEATLDDAVLPGLSSVTVHAMVNGVQSDTSTNNFVFITVEISLDGGSTWATGEECVLREGSGGNASTLWSLTAIHQVTGTVTGDIQARAMVRSAVGAADAHNFENGVIYLEVSVDV